MLSPKIIQSTVQVATLIIQDIIELDQAHPENTTIQRTTRWWLTYKKSCISSNVTRLKRVSQFEKSIIPHHHYRTDGVMVIESVTV